MYILLFIALSGTPAQLGVYLNKPACERAIRAIYETRMYGSVVPKSAGLDAAIDIQLKYQTNYRCVKQN